MNFLQVFGYHEINLGFIRLTYYSMCILLGAIAAYKLSQYFLKKKGFDPKGIENLFYVAFPSGILGARIWYVIAEWNKSFANNPWTTLNLFNMELTVWRPFAIWEGGLAIQGGAIAGVLVGVLFMKKYRKHIPVLLATDCIVPTILVAQAMGRWGNFFNQEVYGECTNTWSFLPSFITDRLTYKINNAGYILYQGERIPLCDGANQMVTPLFLIESMVNLLGFALIVFLIPFVIKLLSEKVSQKIKLVNGDLMCLYFTWYGLVRMIMEPLRNKEFIMGSQVQASKIMAIAFIIGGLLGIVLLHVIDCLNSKKDKAPVQQEIIKKTVPELKDIDLFIFDLDGTLVDTDELIFYSYQKVFDKYRPGYILSEEEKISLLGPTLKVMFEKYFTEDFETLLKTYQYHAKRNAKRLAKLYPGVKDMLERLKAEGKHLALVTSRIKNSCDHMLNAMELNGYFEKIVTLDDVEKAKPSPEGIELCLKEFNVDSSKAIYIGDNSSDYQAATDAHVVTSLVAWSKGRNNAELNPDYLINDFNEIK